MNNFLSSPKLVYLHGFMWGDGYVSKKACQLYIVQKDSREVQKIIKNEIKFKTYTYQPQGNRQIVEVIRFDNEYKDFLIKNGYCSKSLDSPEKILSIIPKELHCYWWRGYVDADGCFYKPKDKLGGAFSITAPINKNWIEESKLMVNLHIQSFSVRKTEFQKGDNLHKSSTLSVTHNKEIKKIGEYIYQGECFGLKRKYKKYQSILKGFKKQTSSTVGVSYQKHGNYKKRWRAYLGRKYLGRFETEKEAIQARLKAQDVS